LIQNGRSKTFDSYLADGIFSRENQGINSPFLLNLVEIILPIPPVSLTPGYKIVKRTSSNTVLAAYVNGYKLPPLYPSSDGFLIDP
jgi:hypothetical protein